MLWVLLHIVSRWPQLKNSTTIPGRHIWKHVLMVGMLVFMVQEGISRTWPDWASLFQCWPDPDALNCPLCGYLKGSSWLRWSAPRTVCWSHLLAPKHVQVHKLSSNVMALISSLYMNKGWSVVLPAPVHQRICWCCFWVCWRAWGTAQDWAPALPDLWR